MSTTIIAIRHAKPLQEGHADETLRPLSREGIAIQRKGTEQLLEKGYRPSAILTSPILRAQQTAEIVAEIFDAPILEESSLGYDFDGDRLLRQFANPDQEKTLVLVGHAPTLADFINRCVGSIVIPKGLSKSGIAVISFENEISFGKAQFIEMMEP
jgi:phosphohistidine phosphatase